MVKIPDDKDKITIDEDRVFVPSIEDTEDNTEEEWFEEYLDLLNEDTAKSNRIFIRFDLVSKSQSSAFLKRLVAASEHLLMRLTSYLSVYSLQQILFCPVPMA
jgi:hypothetical protein